MNTLFPEPKGVGCSLAYRTDMLSWGQLISALRWEKSRVWPLICTTSQNHAKAAHA